MATTNHDILTTSERLKRIDNILRTIRSGKTTIKNAQKIYDNFQREGGYLVWANVWQYVQGELDNGAAMLAHADTMLGELLTASVDDASDTYRTNFTFQAKWRVGEGGVYALDFATASDTIQVLSRPGQDIADAFSDGGVATNDDGTVLKSGDIVFIDGPTLSGNYGYLTVSACTANTLTISTNLQDETCTTTGAEMYLYRRSLDT